ncbi:hypothetical protein TNCV_4704861 [Trichonephila clavipes]|nr:hypothetical protein TNCV_4704861 [Trichonephila clavipes]
MISRADRYHRLEQLVGGPTILGESFVWRALFNDEFRIQGSGLLGGHGNLGIMVTNLWLICRRFPIPLKTHCIEDSDARGICPGSMSSLRRGVVVMRGVDSSRVILIT